MVPHSFNKPIDWRPRRTIFVMNADSSGLRSTGQQGYATDWDEPADCPSAQGQTNRATPKTPIPSATDHRSREALCPRRLHCCPCCLSSRLTCSPRVEHLGQKSLQAPLRQIKFQTPVRQAQMTRTQKIQTRASLRNLTQRTKRTKKALRLNPKNQSAPTVKSGSQH